jgi:hypothetical protein
MTYTQTPLATLRSKTGSLLQKLYSEFGLIKTELDALTAGTRSATIVVAASDSSAKSKAQADYVCDGTDDDVEINAAIQALPATGGSIKFLEGHYYLGAEILVNRSADLICASFNSTIFTLENNANCIMFRITSSNTHLSKCKLIGNKANQTEANPLIQVEAADCSLSKVWCSESKGDGIKLVNGWSLLLDMVWSETHDGYGFYCVPDTTEGNKVSTLKINYANFVNNKGGIYADLSNISANDSRGYWYITNYFGSASVEREIYIKDIWHCNIDNFNILNSGDNSIEFASSASCSSDYIFIGSGYAQSMGENKKSLVADTNTRRILLLGPSFPQDVQTGSSLNPDVLRKGSFWHISGRTTKRVDEVFSTTAATITAGNTSVSVPHGLAESPNTIIITPRTDLATGAYISSRNAAAFVITIPNAQDSDVSFDWYARM